MGAREESWGEYAAEAGRDVVAGTFAGVAQVGVGHPLDTVKVRMQAQGATVRLDASSASMGKERFGGMLDCIKQGLVRDGSARGLYKGAASPLCGAMIQNAACFLSWGVCKKFVLNNGGGAGGPGSEELSTAGLFQAGLLVGVACLFVETPIDLLKIQLQVQVGRGGRYSGVRECAQSIWAQRGVRGMYQGLWANSLRFVPGRAVYMSSFEFAARELCPPDTARSDLPYARCFAAGGFAGGCAWISTYPFDVVRNIMMGDHTDPRKRVYRGVWHCMSSLVKQDGPAVLWRGFVPCMVRAVPVNGCIFVGYTAVSDLLQPPADK